MLHIIKDTPQIDFLGKKFIFLAGSFLLLSIAAIFLVWKGLKLGLDFSGGSVVQILFDKPIVKSALQTDIDEALGSGVSINSLGGEDSGEVLLYFSEDFKSNIEGELKTTVELILTKYYGSSSFEVRRVESIGPKIGGELRTNALYSIFLSLGLVLVYMAFRFKINYGIGAIAALLHDTLITLGAFVITGLDFDLTALAGVLTMVGYSLNDTIVIFDRVRENSRKHLSMSLEEVINLSVNETLSRTIMTFATTFIVVFSMYMWGGESIKGFSFAFLVGLIVGTYSSVFVAAPFAIWSERFNLAVKASKSKA